MNKLTVEDILNIVRSSLNSIEQFAKQDYDPVELGLGEIEVVSKYGGEGKGDTWYIVQYFKDHNIYIRTDGFYTSYNGVDFYKGFGREVFPEQKTITVFE